MMRLTAIFLLIFCAGQVYSQDSTTIKKDSLKVIKPKSQKSPVNSLTFDEYNIFKNGLDKGYSRAAELNNYPGPENIIRYQKELNLSDVQKSQLKKVISDKRFKVLEMGGFILSKEKMMNDMFASGKADDGSIIYYTNQMGLYDAELRNAYLQANLKTRRILTPDQIKKYYKISANTK